MSFTLKEFGFSNVHVIMKTLYSTVLFIVLVATSTNLYSQWNAATNVLVASRPSSVSIYGVVSDNHGGAWVLYNDSSGIRIQHLDSNGYVILPGNGISLSDSGGRQQVSSAFPADDGSLYVGYSIFYSSHKSRFL